MTAQANTAGQLGWLLDNLVLQVDDISQAVVLSRDGLVVAASQNTGKEEADHLSALAAGLQSLARGAGQQVGGGEVRQTIVEMESAFLVVMAAGEGACSHSARVASPFCVRAVQSNSKSEPRPKTSRSSA